MDDIHHKEVGGENPEGQMPFPLPVIEAARRGLLVPFLGAGVSADTGIFPGWRGFLEELLKRAEPYGATQAAWAAELLQAGSFLECAEAAAGVLPRLDFARLMERRFWPPRPANASLGLMEAIDQLAAPLLITTNYDPIPNWVRSFRCVDRQQTDGVALLQSEPQSAAPWLWYWHGRADRAETLVLTRAQYETLYRGDDAASEAARCHLQTVLVNRTLLFIGFSFDDSFVREQFEYLAERFEAREQAYVLVRAGDADLLKRVSALGLTPILYANHGAPLIERLQQLSQFVFPNGPPHRPNRYDNLRPLGRFNGRDVALKQLAPLLDPETAQGRAQAIIGLGGTGKTRLALKAAHEARKRYRLVWWLEASGGEALDNGLRTLADTLGLPTDPAQLRAVVGKWLAEHDGWFLVLDDLRTRNLADELLSSIPLQSAAIITSRDEALGRFWHLTRLTSFTVNEARDFLAGTGIPPQGASEVAKLLGRLPLALAQALGYVASVGIGWKDYAARWVTRRQELLGNGVLHPESDEERLTVWTTWSLAFTQLENDSAEAIALLRFLSFLAPVPYERRWLEQTDIVPQPKCFRETIPDASAADRAIASLRRHSLIETYGAEAVAIHPLVQEVTRARLDEHSRQEWELMVLECHGDGIHKLATVEASLPDRYMAHPAALLQNFGWRQWGSHFHIWNASLSPMAALANRHIAFMIFCSVIRSLAAFARRRDRIAEIAPALVNWAEYHLDMAADGDRVGQIDFNLPTTLAQVAFDLAQVLPTTARSYAEAARRLLETDGWPCEKTSTETWNSLGAAFLGLGEFLHALPLLDAAVSGWEKKFAELSADDLARKATALSLAIARDNRGKVLHALAVDSKSPDPETFRSRAKSDLRRALLLRRKYCDSNDYDLALGRQNLGTHLTETPQTRMGLSLLRSAWRVIRDYFPEGHFERVNCLQQLFLAEISANEIGIDDLAERLRHVYSNPSLRGVGTVQRLHNQVMQNLVYRMRREEADTIERAAFDMLDQIREYFPEDLFGICGTAIVFRRKLPFWMAKSKLGIRARLYVESRNGNWLEIQRRLAEATGEELSDADFV